MVPIAKAVFQESGLRPISLGLGDSDKPVVALCTMFRYSAQILICF